MKKALSVILLSFLFAGIAKAQIQYQPYTYHFYQKFNEDVYSTKTRIHSSTKPFLNDDTLLHRRYYELMNLGVDTINRHSWANRKLFNEHLIDIKDKDYTFYVDYLPDLVIGRDVTNSRRTWINTRGFQFGGTVGKNFYFYTRAYENQAVFPAYYDTYINQIGVVPGLAYDRNNGVKSSKDWSDVAAIISYKPNKYLDFTLGHDKNFIGDGYRSQLLSDYAAAYPFFKVTANLGDVKYMVMWNYMNGEAYRDVGFANGYNRKYGVFHYLDWNVNNRFSLGFFDAVIWGEADFSGKYHGFDFAYANPIIFLRPVEANGGSQANALMGLNAKYKLTDGITAYGQFALDEFESANIFSGNGSSRNKYAYQLGVRGANLLGVKSLNYLLEYNTALPYTYSEVKPLVNYSAGGEPLAHPFGANCREVVGLLNYSYKRFDFSAQVQYARFGLDMAGLNYGKNIFKTYDTAAKKVGNYIGQGLSTDLYYGDLKVAYLLNPKYNLRIEVGALLRNEKNYVYTDRTTMFTVGIRSSFRTIYTDIASNLAH